MLELGRKRHLTCRSADVKDVRPGVEVVPPTMATDSQVGQLPRFGDEFQYNSILRGKRGIRGGLGTHAQGNNSRREGPSARVCLRVPAPLLVRNLGDLGSDTRTSSGYRRRVVEDHQLACGTIWTPERPSDRAPG